MDLSNRANLRKLAPVDGRARLSLMLDHVPGQEGRPVADPYYGEDSGFDATWRDMKAGAQGLLALMVRAL